mgnify:CR=1 FL=1
MGIGEDGEGRRAAADVLGRPGDRIEPLGQDALDRGGALELGEDPDLARRARRQRRGEAPRGASVAARAASAPSGTALRRPATSTRLRATISSRRPMASSRSEVAAGSAGSRQLERHPPELLEDVVPERARRRQVPHDAPRPDQGLQEILVGPPHGTRRPAGGRRRRWSSRSRGSAGPASSRSACRAWRSAARRSP